MKKIVSLMLLFFFITGSFIAAFSPVSASELVEDSWNTKTPMTQARSNFGIVAVEGKIYVIGGYTVDNYCWTFVGINEQYDPVRDTWTTLESMPTPRTHFAIVAYNGKIYCIGGAIDAVSTYMGTAYIPCGVIEVYDPVTNSWDTKEPLPFNGSKPQLTINIQAHVVNSQFFVINDCDLYLYDTITELWIKKDSVPATSSSIPPSYVISVNIDNKLIVIRACYDESTQFVQKVLIYDPKTDGWSEGKSGPEATIYGVGVVTFGRFAPKRVYVLGIRGNNLASSWVANQVYDPACNTWLFAKDVPTDRKNFGVAVVDDVLYVIGGDNGETGCSLNEQYVPIGYHVSTGVFEFLSTHFVVVLVLTVGIVVSSLFFFHLIRRTKRKC
jgi:N-acetylneuraminic acid mutarotase